MSDFTTLHNRKNTSSVKWDMLAEIYQIEDHGDILPMWVADMDFPMAKPIADALVDRIQDGIFGYSFPSPEVANQIVRWVKDTHKTSISADWLVYESGVIPAMSLAIDTFTEPGDRVLIHGPVYPPFRSKPENLGREVVTFSLDEQNGNYSMDFQKFEEALAANIKAFIFCNPHNPGGKVWSKEDVTKLVNLCHQYNVLLISDEIHADLVFAPHQHTTALSVAEHTEHIITCMAPTKTFNLAGLQASYMIVPNEEKRLKLKNQAMRSAHMGLTIPGATAMQAAYEYGKPWLDELFSVLQENITYVKNELENNLPGIHVPVPEGTYLLWIDYRKLGVTEEDMMKALLEDGKLALEPGTKYGPEGDGFLRMNIACPLDTVKDGVQRFITAVNTLKEEK